MVDFTPVSINNFRSELLDRLLTVALPIARDVVPSSTLAASFIPRDHGLGRGDIFTPYEFAVILHDGRDAVYPKSGGAPFLIYFVDPADDPRIRFGYPEKLDARPKLTQDQFDFGVAENRRLYLANPAGGRNQHMIIVRDASGRPAGVGPARGTFFFSERTDDIFLPIAEGIIFNNFDAFVKANIGRKITQTTKIRL